MSEHLKRYSYEEKQSFYYYVRIHEHYKNLINSQIQVSNSNFLEIQLSSAYIWYLQSMSSKPEFIYNKNSRGPNDDAWGTPLMTFFHSDFPEPK